MSKSYIRWNSWKRESFASINSTQRCSFNAEIKKTGRHFSADTKVLEVGFGNGSFLRYAREKNWCVTGTELNELLVEYAVEDGFKAICAKDLHNLKDDTYDLIVAFDVLEHISQDILPSFFREVRRILKDDGCFIARFPNCDSPFGLKNQFGDITHVSALGAGKAKWFCDEAKLQILSISGEAHPIMGVRWRHKIHRLIANPIKAMIGLFVNFVFYPRSPIAFTAINLVLVCQKTR
jgi:SAM-dependent methyltransferase